DVSPLPVRVAQQREERAAVGVIFEPLDLRRDAVLVALEIDLAVELLVAAAPLLLALDEMRDRPALVQVGVDDPDLLTLAGRDGSQLDQHYLASACSAKLISWPAFSR